MADGGAPAKVVCLEDYKASRLPPARFGQFSIEDGHVVITMPSGEAILLRPGTARAWANAVAMLADQAEREGST